MGKSKQPKSIKQVIILRKDLNMSPGKAAAQSCHASLGAALLVKKNHRKHFKNWMADGQTKVVVMVDTEEEMSELHKTISGDTKLDGSWFLVVDAGRTELTGQNVTALGIGPLPASTIDTLTGKLKLYR